jgi:hypothetical protein
MCLIPSGASTGAQCCLQSPICGVLIEVSVSQQYDVRYTESLYGVVLKSLLHLKNSVKITLTLDSSASRTEDFWHCVKLMFPLLRSLIEEGYKVIIIIGTLEIWVMHEEVTEEC